MSSKRLISTAFEVARQEGVIPLAKKFSNYLYERNPVRQFKIRTEQDKLLAQNYPSNIERLIIFLTPGHDAVSGGILSISSIYDESRKIKNIHGCEVIMCTIPGDPRLLQYTKFSNRNCIYGFSQVISYFQKLRSLLIHIPEYCITQFLENLSTQDIMLLTNTGDVHINIMIQNIQLLESKGQIEKLGKLGKLTCTTDDEQYSTPELRNMLGFPLHKLHHYVSPEQYNRKTYTEKQNLMIVSPDYHPRKAEILSLLSKAFPDLRIRIIQNLTYEEYKRIISLAKWSLTFGEGLDNYFVETIFSGGIGYAVYNTAFFTEDFKSLKTVYDSYDTLIEKICSDIRELDNEIAHTKYNNEQYELCSRYYNYKEYVANLTLFYRGKYTYE